MAFIKTGDGKITHIIKSDDELSDKQKKTVEELTEDKVKKEERKSN